MNLVEPAAHTVSAAGETSADATSADSAAPLSPGTTPPPTSARTAFWAHVVILVSGAVAILWIDRHQWFLTEDWVFFTLNRPRLLNGDWGHFLFGEYRGHWITTTNLLYEALYRLVGVRSYIPYLLPTILATCACSALVRVHMRRAGVEPWLATGVAALALFLAYGAEDIAKAWQFSFTGGLAFGLGQLWASDHDGPVSRRDALAVGLGLLALVTGGIGVLFAGLVFLSLALRGRWRAAIVNVAPLAAVYVVWYLAYGHEWDNAEAVSLRDLHLVAEPVWHALSLSADGLTRLGGTGGIIVVVLAGLAIVTRVPARKRGTAPVVALAIGAPAFFIFSATTRLASFEVLSDRYLHVGEILLLPLVGVVLSRLLSRSRVLVAAGVVVLGVLVVTNGLALNDRAGGYADVNAVLKPKVLALAALPSLRSFPRDAVLSEPLLLFVTAGAVERLRGDGAFGSVEPLTPDEELAVEADLGVRLTPTEGPSTGPTPAGGATLIPPVNPAVKAVKPDCVAVDQSSGPQPVALHVARPTSIPLRTTSNGQFVVRVRRVSTSSGEAVRLFDLERGSYDLRVDLHDADLYLELPGQGVTRLCNVST